MYTYIILFDKGYGCKGAPGFGSLELLQGAGITEARWNSPAQDPSVYR